MSHSRTDNTPALPVNPRIAIVGTGAIGGYYGALLARAGCEVHFLLRSDYEAISKDGLRVHLHKTGETVHIHPALAARTPEEIGEVDLVLIALKTTANAHLPELIKPLVGKHTLVLSMQNGLGNIEALEAFLPREQLLGQLCFICVNRTAPGVIENFFPGYVAIGEPYSPPTPRLKQLAQLWERAGVKCLMSDSLGEALWRKLCWNVPFNGIAIAAGGITTDVILASEPLTRYARLLMEEIRAAASAVGYEIEPRFLEKQIEVTQPMGAYKPSSLIDYLEGRPVEIESIWGEPLRQGQAAGVSMPHLESLYLMLQHRVTSRG